MAASSSKKAPAERQRTVVKTIRLRSGVIHLRGDGLMEIVADAGAEVGIADAEEHIVAERDLAQGTRRPILVDMGLVSSVSREARGAFASDRNAEFVGACALLVKSPVSRMIGNFFIGFNQAPTYPTKLFTSHDAAVAWLQGYVQA